MEAKPIFPGSCCRALQLGLMTLAYMCGDLILNKFAIGAGWTILWPLNGITVALMLRVPRKHWPFLLFAIQLGIFIGEGLDTQDWSLKLLERVWSLAEVLISAYLLPSFASFEEWLSKPNLVKRIAAATIVGPALSGAGFAVQQHLLLRSSFTVVWHDWATPDILGIGVTLPVTLALLAPETRCLLSRAKLPQTLLLLIASSAVSLAIFSEEAYPLLFLLYPMLLFVDSRLSFAGASIVVFLSSVTAVYCTVHGFGPFGHWSPYLLMSGGTALQIYLGFHAVALLPLSLILLERKQINLQLSAANKQLSTLAQLDFLTGIPNRRCFHETITDLWSLSSSRPLSLLMIDVDHFKQFNDVYGHPAGDDCLVQIAGVLSRIAKQRGIEVARYGGEEFVALLPGCTSSDSLAIAEEIREAVLHKAIPHDANDPCNIVTVSIGCGSSSKSDESPGELIERADLALYKAKRAGRNRWETLDLPVADGGLPLILTQILAE